MKIIILQFMAIIAMILISCNDKENSVYLKKWFLLGMRHGEKLDQGARRDRLCRNQCS